MKHSETVEVIEHLWIPMPDGTRLAARMWLPIAAGVSPVPAIFEYIPYRKADMVRARDERNHPFLAEHGYAALRVDMRGSGDSEGSMPDMYEQNELDDARHVINWLSEQPWCNGKVGMFGTSWGGTASLQANIDAPKALKAIIAVCATHDRYDDDIHHMGGCLLTDTFEWGATLPAILAAPPTPNVGDDWLQKWQTRLDNLTWPVENWVRHEARGTYWRHGSVIHEADKLSRPILAVGGWSDRYSNSVMSLSSARPDLTWGVVGPWGHHYPDHGKPGPAIGFQQLALEWWDRWLKDDISKADWPKLRVWQRGFDHPVDSLDQGTGTWIETGPVDQATSIQSWHMSKEGLAQYTLSLGNTWQVPSDLRVGLNAGDTGYFGRFGGLPGDQAEPDQYACIFDTPPLGMATALYGKSTLTLKLTAPKQPRQILIRLSDVAPDGTVHRVGFVMHNLALSGTGDITDDPPNGKREVAISLPSTAYLFQSGHRIRLSIGGSCWPLVWPTSRLDGVTLHAGHLSLPILDHRPKATVLQPAQDLPEIKSFRATQDASLTRHCDMRASGVMTSGWHQPLNEVEYPDICTRFAFESKAHFAAKVQDPLSASSNHEHMARYTRSDGTAVIVSSLSVSADKTHYKLLGALTATWNGTELTSRKWQIKIARAYS